MIMNNTVLSNSESPSGVLSEDISKEQLQGKILKVSFNQDFYSVGLKISYDIQLENFCGQTFKIVHTLTPISSDSAPITKEDVVVLDKDGNKFLGNSASTMNMNRGVDDEGIYSACETFFSSDFPVKKYGIYSYNGKLDLYDLDNNLLSTQGYYLNIKYRRSIFKKDEVKVVQSPNLSLSSKLSVGLLQTLLVIALCCHALVVLGSMIDGEYKSPVLMFLNLPMPFILWYFIKKASIKEKIGVLVISYIIFTISDIYIRQNSQNESTGKDYYSEMNDDKDYDSSETNNVSFVFNTPSDVMAYLTGKCFYNGDYCIEVKTDGVYLNGQCLSFAPTIQDFSQSRAHIMANTTDNGRFCFSVDANNGTVTDENSGDVYYLK